MRRGQGYRGGEKGGAGAQICDQRVHSLAERDGEWTDNRKSLNSLRPDNRNREIEEEF